TLDGCGIISLSFHHRFEGSSRHDRLTHEPRFPTNRITARVDATNNGVKKGGTIPTALHVVFARPNHLDWSSRSLCYMNGFDHEVGLRSSPTAKSSAKEGGVDLDLLCRKSCCLRCGRTIHCLELCSR